jgi:hypothetical protein
MLNICDIDIFNMENVQEHSSHYQIITYHYVEFMLGGSLVTTAWHVLRLQMNETPSTYGG